MNIEFRPSPGEIPGAHYVEYAGLCPCGCGSYKMLLFDYDAKPIASFGYTKEGWRKFCAAVFASIEAEEAQSR